MHDKSVHNFAFLAKNGLFNALPSTDRETYTFSAMLGPSNTW